MLIDRRSFIKMFCTFAASCAALELPLKRTAAAVPVRLMTCHVAGTSYSGAAGLEPALNPGDRLTLMREPSNPYDRRAILVLTREGRKLGYIPRAKNAALASMMDDGASLRGQLLEKQWVGNWLRLDMDVLQ